ncbi:MAG: hypothetical protein WD179_10050 [Actinomycetota bacterium]
MPRLGELRRGAVRLFRVQLLVEDEHGHWWGRQKLAEDEGEARTLYGQWAREHFDGLRRRAVSSAHADAWADEEGRIAPHATGWVTDVEHHEDVRRVTAAHDRSVSKMLERVGKRP